MGEQIRSVEIMPNTWAGVLPVILVLIEAGDAKGRAAARAELQNMARLADMAVAAMKEGKL